jgi:DNA polymerase I
LAPTGTRFVKKEKYVGIFPEILSTLIAARGRVKKSMRSAPQEEKRILNAKQLALKDVSNSFYGYIGYIRARLYVLEMANAITAYGRANLEKTKKLIEGKFDVDVVYGDTDSIFLKTRIEDIEKAKELGEVIASYVSDYLEGSLELDFEKIYKTFLILTKKRYAGWKFSFSPDGWTDYIEMKGIETVRRDWCPLVSDTMKEILDVILKEGDVTKAVSTLKQVQEKLKKNEIPLEKLTIIKGITKSIDNYEGMQPHIELARKMAERNPSEKPKVGDRLGFVITKGRDLLSKRAEDPEFIRKNNIAIDADYYIHSQLFPPIERIFDSLGITKSDIFDVGRQKTMFDVMKQQSLDSWENFVCKKCGKDYKRMPLRGFCDCGGEMLFSKGNVMSGVIRKN